ncbi:MAG: hypothetical protein NE330_18680 [Lentisphaeraceae bacterium]|nr:hypothetical protein [Lentisphaeraceae bacterium]
MTGKLIFIYNADSGKLNALGHSLHKFISPSTYKCDLCRLTHGFFKEKQEWSDFLSQLDLDADFLHKDELIDDFLHLKPYDAPVVLLEKNGSIEELINSASFKNISDINQLVTAIHSALALY